MLFSYGVYSRWHPPDQKAPPFPRSPEAGPPSAPRLGYSAAALPAPAIGPAPQRPAEAHAGSWAVLAFTPEDALWAEWLFRNLNGHPVPAGMTDTVTSQGFARLGSVSVFPDPRDPHHAARYPQALQKSGYLVVVCSPHSAQCPEVDEKIRAFKNAGGEGRILALLVEGGPVSGLENAPKTASPDWLPPWLRWRVMGDALGPADPGEPVTVDARPGRASLKEVRDLLLSALIEIEPWELEVMGVLNQPLEVAEAAPPQVVPPPPAPAPTPAVAPASAPVPAPKEKAEAARPRKISPIILTALICVSGTLGVAWWAFGPGKSDRDHATAARVPGPELPPVAPAPLVSPAPQPLAQTASPSQPEAPAEPAPASPLPATTASVEPPSPVSAQAFPPTSPLPPAPAPSVPAPVLTEPLPETPRLATPAPVPYSQRPRLAAMSAISPLHPAAPAPVPVPIKPTAPPTLPASPAPPVTAIDLATRNDMSALHRRGDMALERRLFDEALAYYEKGVAALDTSGPNASADYRTEAALLCRKLGVLQLQMTSTTEARNTFVQGRKILLQIKKEGPWNASRARVLAEIESSLRRLPRD